jgi:hypothetical protein
VGSGVTVAERAWLGAVTTVPRDVEQVQVKKSPRVIAGSRGDERAGSLELTPWPPVKTRHFRIRYELSFRFLKAATNVQVKSGARAAATANIQVHIRMTTFGPLHLDPGHTSNSKQTLRIL